MGINIIEWPSLQYCTMSAFRGDALQRNAMLHKSSFKIIDNASPKRKFHCPNLPVLLIFFNKK